MSDKREKIISLEEEKQSRIGEDAIKKSLKQQEIPIPDALKPEQIKQRLQKMETKEYENRKRAYKKKHLKGAWVSAAAGLLLIFGVAIGSNILSHKTEDNSMMSASDVHSQEKVKADNNSYDEAYEVLNQCYQMYYAYEEDGKDIISDAVNGVIDRFRSEEVKKESAADVGEDMESDSAGGVEEDMKSKSALSEAESDSAANSLEYSKNNVRTAGVEECNIVRTDGKYIYEYDESSSYIHIYQAKGADTPFVGEINLNEYQLMVEDGFYVNNGILTICASVAGASKEEEYGEKTRTLVFDVKNPSKPELLHGFFQDGSYQESRMVGDVLYIFSSYNVQLEQMNPEKPESYIPKFEGKLVEEENLYIQPNCYLESYTMISSINVTDCTYIDKKTILGGSGERYVSSNHIYLMDMDYAEDNEIQFLRFTYEDGKLSDKTNATMRGELNDDYSLDEYQGYLRMVTHYYDDRKGDYVNGLFIYDENLKQTGSIKGIAKGEEIKSARFIGETAYFVTYRNTDPLFAVDVSNPAKPKVLGYLKIPGFSTYLHPYGEHQLLGIGLETDENSMVLGLKLSMYDISDSANIKEVDKLVLKEYNNSEVLYDANALLVDVDKNLIGFDASIEEYDSFTESVVMKQDYLVYSYEKGKGFVRKLRQSNSEFERGYVDVKNRGLYINDYFYVVTIGQKINAYKMGKTSFKLSLGNKKVEGTPFSKSYLNSLTAIYYSDTEKDIAKAELIDKEGIQEFASVLRKQSYKECDEPLNAAWERYALIVKGDSIKTLQVSGNYIIYDDIVYHLDNDISSELREVVFQNK